VKIQRKNSQFRITEIFFAKESKRSWKDSLNL
jgi:hypothetical protein